MRIWGSLIAGGVFLLSQYGPRFFVGSEPARRSTVDLLGRIDEFIRSAWSPTLSIIAISLLIAIWVTAPGARHLVDKWFGAKIKEFNIQFAYEHHQRARNNLTWFLESAYRKNEQDILNMSLYDALINVRFPNDFPREDLRIQDYAINIEWPDTHSKKVFDFIKKQFLYMTQNAGNDAYILSDRYRDLADTVRITGKFWDDWAHEIFDGKLR